MYIVWMNSTEFLEQILAGWFYFGRYFIFGFTAGFNVFWYIDNLIGRGKVNKFQTPREKIWFVVPRTRDQNFSLQFEVNLLESNLGLKRNTAFIRDNFVLNHSLDSSSFTSNWRLKFWSRVLGTTNHKFFPKGLKFVDFAPPY